VRIGPRQYQGTAADTTTYGLERSRHELHFAGYRDTQIDKIGSKIVNINKQTYGGANQQLIQSADLAFFTVPPQTNDIDNTVERMRITDSGTVGIGVTAPTVTLDVAGAGKFTAISTNIISTNTILANNISTISLAVFEGFFSTFGTELGFSQEAYFSTIFTENFNSSNISNNGNLSNGGSATFFSNGTTAASPSTTNAYPYVSFTINSASTNTLTPVTPLLLMTGGYGGSIAGGLTQSVGPVLTLGTIDTGGGGGTKEGYRLTGSNSAFYGNVDMQGNNISNVGEYLRFSTGSYMYSAMQGGYTSAFLDIVGTGGDGQLRLINGTSEIALRANSDLGITPTSGYSIVLNGPITANNNLNMNNCNISNINTIRTTAISTNTISTNSIYAGSIGVLCNSPGYTLDVNGNARIGGMFFDTNATTWTNGTTHTLYGDSYTGSTKYIQWAYNNTPGTTIADAANMNIACPLVGINQSAPTAQLHVKTSGPPTYVGWDSTWMIVTPSANAVTPGNTPALGFGYSVVSNTSYIASLEPFVAWRNIEIAGSNIYLMTTDGGAGNVGINTRSPAYKLDVNGPSRIESISTTTISTNSITTSNIRVGTISTNSFVSYPGLAQQYTQSILAEQGTGAGLQEMLIFRGSSASDRIRLQTTGYIVFETGVGARVYPTITSNVTPSWMIDINGCVGVGIIPSGTTNKLDVAGQGRFQSLSTTSIMAGSMNLSVAFV
jgi:hypothetical protein